jgi:hypothetical protein
MNDKFKSAVDEAHANIQRNQYLRNDWDNATEDGRKLMLLEMLYNVGFDRGYEHRKKVEAAK